MKPFAARFPGDCPRCKKKINVDEIITARMSSPWVHVGCPVELRPQCQARIDEWKTLVKANGFIEMGNDRFWQRGELDTFFDLNEHFVPFFHVAWMFGEEADQGDPSFTTYDPKAVVLLADLLEKHFTKVDEEFDDYRQRLLKRFEQK